MAVIGKAQKLQVTTAAAPLIFVPDDGPEDGSANLTLNPGDVDHADRSGAAAGERRWQHSRLDWPIPARRNLRVADSGGRTGTVAAAIGSFTPAASTRMDPDIQEFALVSSVLAVTTPYPHTQVIRSRIR